jgi:hypothetical protein
VDLGEVKIERSLMERLDIAHQQNDSIYYAIDIKKIDKETADIIYKREKFSVK